MGQSPAEIQPNDIKELLLNFSHMLFVVSILLNMINSYLNDDIQPTATDNI